MNRKPSRSFLFLALIMVFLLMAGLIVVGALISENVPVTDDKWTATAALATNSAIMDSVSQTQTYEYVKEIATNLRGLEPPPGYFETSTAEKQTEIFQVNATLGATEAAKYWASETAYLPKIFETLTKMETETALAITQIP